MIHYTNLPTDTIKLTYDQLDNELVKSLARKELIEVDIAYYKKDLVKYKELAKTNIHSVINCNGKKKLNRFVEKKAFISKITNDIKYCEKYILGNLCHFTSDGKYITYSLKTL
jgi:hypothetical protein